MNFEATWRATESRADGSQGVVARRVFPESERDMFAGFDHSSRSRVFVLQVDPRILESERLEIKARGLSVKKSIFREGPTPNAVVVRLVLPQFKTVFGALIEDVARAVASTNSDSEAVDVLMDRLKQWRYLLDKSNSPHLSNEEQRGLYGELHFLQDALLSCLSPENAVGSWVGPLREIHDFCLSGVDVEHKTSTISGHSEIRISSERQLLTQGERPLFIRYLVLEVSPNSGETLPNRVKAIRSVLCSSPTAAFEFEEKLRLAGYVDEHIGEYRATYYSASEPVYYRVCDGFPRLIPDQIPPGVMGVSYGIDLSYCAQWVVSEDMVIPGERR